MKRVLVSVLLISVSTSKTKLVYRWKWWHLLCAVVSYILNVCVCVLHGNEICVHFFMFEYKMGARDDKYIMGIESKRKRTDQIPILHFIYFNILEKLRRFIETVASCIFFFFIWNTMNCIIYRAENEEFFFINFGVVHFLKQH